MKQARQPASEAREKAARILRELYDGESASRDLLAGLESESAFAQADAALTAELVLGVTRHRITCEHLAAHYFRGRWGGVRPSIRTAFALGVYQLCWLDRVPDHAAVDQTVRLAMRYGKGTADTVNAVLRKISAARGDVIARPDAPDPRRYLPLDEQRGRLFNEDVFPDPVRRPLEWLVAATGHPMYLVERWHRRFKPALARQICEAGQFRRPLVLRANRTRVSPESLIERLHKRGLTAECITEARAVIVRGRTGEPPPHDPEEASSMAAHRPIHAVDVPEIAEGLCQPQDATAQMVLESAGLQPGQVVLDLCAGLGTKATQAAECMNNQGDVIATDVDDRKLEAVTASAARLGLTSVRTTTMPSLEATLREPVRPVDVILVDAPCSNTGVLGRRPEARHRASHKHLLELIAIQRDVLTKAAALAGPTTRILYSTCSIEREENEDQIAWFSATFPDWHAAQSHLTLPGPDWDGGFFAMLERD
ncbi:Ribosomal RNA small subunit methyltransferase B [Phycisphaerae bacterium RAS2]|nr:Ribosomal RNA small subunit methyltransferase B [Phycisphaerae bacterium RAS2]